MIQFPSFEFSTVKAKQGNCSVLPSDQRDTVNRFLLSDHGNIIENGDDSLSFAERVLKRHKEQKIRNQIYEIMSYLGPISSISECMCSKAG